MKDRWYRELSVNIFHGCYRLILMSTVSARQPLFQVDVGSGNGFHDQPRAFAFLNVRPSLACDARISEAVEKIVLGLEEEAELEKYLRETRFEGTVRDARQP